MGQGTEREKELRAMLDRMVPDGREKVLWYPKLLGYLKKRDAMLDALVAAVKTTDLRRAEESKEWKAALSKHLPEIAKAYPGFDGFRDEPSMQLLAFHTQFQLEEAAFLGAFKSSDLGDDVDVILTIARRLEEKTENLDKQWARTLDTTRQFKNGAEAVGQELRGIIDKAAKEVALQHRFWIEEIENLQAAAEKLFTKETEKARKTAGEAGEKIDTLPEGLMDAIGDAVLDGIDDALGALLKGFVNRRAILAGIYQTYLERLSKLSSTFARHRMVAISFDESRKDVEDFLEQVNLVKARQSFTQAGMELARMAGAMKTSGQKSDFEVFRKAVAESLKKVIDQAEDKHDKFVRKHEHKFFGPVSGQYFEELTGEGRWESLARELGATSLNGALQRFYREGTTGVSARGLTPELRDGINEELRRAFKEHVKELERIEKGIAQKDAQRELLELARRMGEVVR